MKLILYTTSSENITNFFMTFYSQVVLSSVIERQHKMQTTLNFMVLRFMNMTPAQGYPTAANKFHIVFPLSNFAHFGTSHLIFVYDSIPCGNLSFQMFAFLFFSIYGVNHRNELLK